MKVAVIHDWLTGMRGGEFVLEAILELFPAADIYTLIAQPDQLSETIRRHRIVTSSLQRIPGGVSRYRYFLPFFPKFIEEFSLRGYDLILSSSHCVAKGVRRPRGVPHVSYVHAPMRYIWDRFEDYFGPGQASAPVRLAARAVRKSLQRWDRRTSQPGNVDLLIANSQFIADRMLDAYGRDAEVVYPFVRLEHFQNAHRRPGDRYLLFGAFAPYKRFDLAIQACRDLGVPLTLAGSGQDEAKLRAMLGPDMEFVSRPSDEQVIELFSTCKAYLFPGVEDFGITPLEAMACGAPVIALGAGGARETVTARTGVLFEDQTVEEIKAAIRSFESRIGRFEPAACREQAAQFSKARFQREYLARVRTVIKG